VCAAGSVNRFPREFESRRSCQKTDLLRSGRFFFLIANCAQAWYNSRQILVLQFGEGVGIGDGRARLSLSGQELSFAVE
jgi:hypothetical protein